MAGCFPGLEVLEDVQVRRLFPVAGTLYAGLLLRLAKTLVQETPPMDETGANDRPQDRKARVQTPTTRWGPIRKPYLKPERPRARSLFGCRVDSGKLLPAGVRVGAPGQR